MKFRGTLEVQSIDVGSNDVGDPTVTSGSAVPAASEPNGSLYMRTNGLLYTRVGGAWVNEDAAGAAAAAAAAQADATQAFADAAAAQSTADACNNRDMYAAVAVADIGGGVLDTPLTCTIRRNSSAGDIPTGSVRFMIVATSVQYGPPLLDATVTFGAATLGTIVASGAGWVLVASEANNATAFACTVSRAASPGVVYFRATPAEASDAPDSGALAIISNSDIATWSV